ncbi:putative iron-regulated membrane protein [Paraburkholderia terricola]|uniref:hypothetical protein n=1 Tax=Paraburkholderia terricola TaxID=169427 RepID=UPI0028669A7E|nr:hypothetical protein [Paraburkholderia terricola]MDR6449103.1 putative iron-regulated membrane protein [Paraburkholderia terricola]
MRTWLALLGTPSAVLAALSIDYALVPPACTWRTMLPLGGVTGAALLFSVIATLLAWRRWREASLIAPASAVALPARPAMLACTATLVGLVSTLALVAMWIPQWLISACV